MVRTVIGPNSLNYSFILTGLVTAIAIYSVFSIAIKPLISITLILFATTLFLRELIE